MLVKRHHLSPPKHKSTQLTLLPRRAGQSCPAQYLLMPQFGSFIVELQQNNTPTLHISKLSTLAAWLS